ncbi:MAG: endonuclease protein [Devosia sp.]|uniref:endonuclease domain-containing protein n=1 Tax=Devosia sp. TaxID=1871048 RepID=UPI0026187920|nr:endonuclease domain-containing protein [Devosia sp.]MDB5589123.1 endonuclease protein [Devosia sp.]
MPGRARTLRNNPPEPERRLWQLLRELRPLGFHVRRQVPLGPYILDFACHHAKLAIEVDGDTHFTDEAIARDEVRDAMLVAAGYQVIRVTNDDVMTNLDGIGIMLHDVLMRKSPLPPRLPPTPNPSPQGGGESAPLQNTGPSVPSSPPPGGEGQGGGNSRQVKSSRSVS